MSGGQFVALAVAGRLLLLGGGLAVWTRAARPMRDTSLLTARTMAGMIVVILAGMLSSSLGYWLLATLLFILAFLVVVVVVGYQITGTWANW